MNLKSFIVVIGLLASCTTDSRDKSTASTDNTAISKTCKHTIAILPFSGVDSNLVNELKNGIQKQLAADLSILNNTSLPVSAFMSLATDILLTAFLHFSQTPIRKDLKK